MRSALRSPFRTSLLAAAWLTAGLALTAPASSAAPAPFDPEDGKAAEDGEQTPAIEWHDDLIEAHLDADAAGRPILLYVRSSMCESCDEMFEKTLVDPRVVEAASAFTWVLYDKEEDREELLPFHVFSFPSVLVLGPKNENVYRFDGFKPPTVFLAELHQALRRYALFEKGEEWDARRPRPSTLFTGKPNNVIAGLPINEPIQGIAFVEGKLYIVQQRNLFGFDAETITLQHSFPLPESQIRDICTDGKLIYALPWGWTKGDPIYALDPATGSTVLTIVTERNKKQPQSSAQGIEWFKGELYVLADRGRIYVVDPVTGEIRISLKVDIPTYGLAWDGEHMVTVNQRGVHFLSLSGKTVRSVATNYPLGAVGFKDGTYFLGESVIRDFDREHRFVKVWPETTVIYRTNLD